MNRDTSVSAFNAEFAFENVNLRLATNEGNTMMSWVNEKGTAEMSVHIALSPWDENTKYSDSLQGTTIGTAVLNHRLVIFTTSEATSTSSKEDYIYVLEVDGEEYSFVGKLLFHGDLGFDANYPIETLTSYESENIQKVYWTDNLNQPRMINIAPYMDSKTESYNNGSFDFVQELALQEEVNVTKIFGTGEFPAGVIQYAFTYYNKYGQESNIFYTTPLQYITYVDRGGSADSKIANAFKVVIRNPDTNFDYLRTYSILRTSKDATPLVKRVRDIALNGAFAANTLELSTWGFNNKLGTNSDTRVLLSTDGGFTYDSILVCAYPTDEGCPSPNTDKGKDASYWGSLDDTAEIYSFSYTEYPDMVLKIINGSHTYYFTWQEKPNSTAKIYLGLSDSTGVLVSEYSYLAEDGTTVYDVNNINEYSSYTQKYLYFIDDGLQGDTVDPTELLYKGGEEIKVKTMEQKDSTLFLGNITTIRPYINIQDTILENNGVSKESPIASNNVTSKERSRKFTVTSKAPFTYLNTLDSSNTTYQGAACFKSKEYYRLGVQFQYKNGKWSEPCWIGDAQNTIRPTTNENSGYCMVGEFQYEMKMDFANLYEEGYRRARPVFAVPKISDRTILCQGIGAPTMYRIVDRYSNYDEENYKTSPKEGSLYAQSSWLFRMPVPYNTSVTGYTYGDASNGGGWVTYKGKLKSHFDELVITEGNTTDESYLKIMSPWLRNTEIMGTFDDNHSFQVDDHFITFHSPELILDESFYSIDFSGCYLTKVGYVSFSNTYGDISIQTSTPTIGTDAAGFVHRSIITEGGAALVSGAFYNDYVVDDLTADPTYGAYETDHSPINFPVFMWHRNGSLNNDVNRDARSAELLKKKISNYRLGSTTYTTASYKYATSDIQFFSSDELTIQKVDGHVYMGNIDTMITPSSASLYPLIGKPWNNDNRDDFYADSDCYLSLKDLSDSTSDAGIYEFTFTKILNEKANYWKWRKHTGDIGDKVKGLANWRDPISIKYKSTPHIVAKLSSTYNSFGREVNGLFNAGNANPSSNDNKLPLIELSRSYDKDTFMGGTSDEALQAATWIPCGPVLSFDDTTSSLTLNYKWGDTYFQRFECLKTYPYTTDDKNQVIEIASFMVETRVNIDGRYDRNRAQVSNLNMTPQNFNLVNPIYSQMDNFFSYKILDKSYYENVDYPNNITWTKTKESGADIDLWTNVTLASTLEMDGNKGRITKLVRFNDQLIAFQDKGISQILYNENTQISTTEGVPIEIANSGKVQGKRYYSDTIGCSNKWSITTTPSGIYFMDNNEKSIYLFNGQLNNLTLTGGFNSWAKMNLEVASREWSPEIFSYGSTFVTYYDRANQDVLFIDSNTALAYSEKFNCFTSFYDYGGVPYFCNLDDMGIWIKNHKLWLHQGGEGYCNFFGTNKPFSMTLIANQEPQLDKIFTNLEFRACVEGEGTFKRTDEYHTLPNYSPLATYSFIPSLPFDYLEVWDEYQHGMLTLSDKNGHDRYTHGTTEGSLNRKYRIWRCDIPRDNYPVKNTLGYEEQLGIKRVKVRPLDRIRNPWAYIKLEKKAADKDSVLSKTEIHDIMVTYYG